MVLRGMSWGSCPYDSGFLTGHGASRSEGTSCRAVYAETRIHPDTRTRGACWVHVPWTRDSRIPRRHGTFNPPPFSPPSLFAAPFYLYRLLLIRLTSRRSPASLIHNCTSTATATSTRLVSSLVSSSTPTHPTPSISHCTIYPPNTCRIAPALDCRAVDIVASLSYVHDVFQFSVCFSPFVFRLPSFVFSVRQFLWLATSPSRAPCLYG